MPHTGTAARSQENALVVRFSGPPAVVAPEVDDRVPAPVTPIRWANATLFVPAPTFSTTFAAPTMVDPFNQVLFCDSPRLDAGAAQPDPTAVVDEFGITGHPAGAALAAQSRRFRHSSPARRLRSCTARLTPAARPRKGRRGFRIRPPVRLACVDRCRRRCLLCVPARCRLADFGQVRVGSVGLPLPVITPALFEASDSAASHSSAG